MEKGRAEQNVNKLRRSPELLPERQSCISGRLSNEEILR